MFIIVRLTQHVSSIIMLIVRRRDYTKKLLVVNALLCWLQSCRVGTRLQPTQHGIHHKQFFCIVFYPDDEHNDARNMLS